MCIRDRGNPADIVLAADDHLLDGNEGPEGGTAHVSHAAGNRTGRAACVKGKTGRNCRLHIRRQPVHHAQDAVVPVSYTHLSGLWRFNESEPDSNDRLMDSSGNGRDFNIINWSGTTANLLEGWRGHYFRFNINNPTSEKTYLQAVNDGSIFAELGQRIVVGGWMNPVSYTHLGAIPQIINAGIQLLTSMVSALPEIITAIVAAIPQIIDGLVTAILGSIPQIRCV